MTTVLISGAASGLGLAFLRAYTEDPSNTVIAIDKDRIPEDVVPPSSIQSHVVDVTSEQSIAAFVKSCRDIPIDLVIHSAGMRGLVPRQEDARPDDVAACETLQVMDVPTLLTTFHINAVGTFSLLRSLLPNLRLAKDPKVVLMSSRMGSVGANVGGSAYAYRASKAALNAMVKSLSIDVPEVAFILCHPGRVETNLVRCKEAGAISAEESVTGLLPLLERWNRDDSGKFYDRFGEPIQW